MTTVNLYNSRAAGVELIADLQDYSSGPRDELGKMKQPLTRRRMLKPGPNEIDSSELELFRTGTSADSSGAEP